jgi:hypothetical protein
VGAGDAQRSALSFEVPLPYLERRWDEEPGDIVKTVRNGCHRRPLDVALSEHIDLIYGTGLEQCNIDI